MNMGTMLPFIELVQGTLPLVLQSVARSVSRSQMLVTANGFPSSLILFILDDGDDTFLQNTGSYKSHTASHPTRRHSS
jgi:hypothetical protein